MMDRTKIIDTMEAERFRIERKGVKQAAAFGFKIRKAVLDAFRQGRPLGPIIQTEAARLVAPMQDAMEAAHLQGVMRTTMTARTSKRRKAMSLANVQSEAVAYIQERLHLSDVELAAIRAAYNSAVASFSGDIAGVLEAKVSKAVAEAMSRGMHVREGIKAIQKAFDDAGVTPTNSYMVENVFRTQTAIAYNAGRWQANQAPEIQEILWGYEYAAVMDDRTRPAHAALDGTRLPKDDPRWQQIWPPNGYGCRCSTIEIYIGDREAKPTRLPTVTKDDAGNVVPVGPDEGWGFNVGTVLPRAA